MQKKRLSVLFAAGALAGLFNAVQAPEAQACTALHNIIKLTLGTGRTGKYCVPTTDSIEIKSLSLALSNRGIIVGTVTTKFEPEICSFYLFTREGNRHFRFRIGAFDSKTTIARRDTYFGFRLGC